MKACNESDCENRNSGDEIHVLRNREFISSISKEFEVFDQCYETGIDDVFEFHAGGTDGVSYLHFPDGRKKVLSFEISYTILRFGSPNSG